MSAGRRSKGRASHGQGTRQGILPTVMMRGGSFRTHIEPPRQHIVTETMHRRFWGENRPLSQTKKSFRCVCECICAGSLLPIRKGESMPPPHYIVCLSYRNVLFCIFNRKCLFAFLVAAFQHDLLVELFDTIPRQSDPRR